MSCDFAEQNISQAAAATHPNRQEDLRSLQAVIYNTSANLTMQAPGNVWERQTERPGMSRQQQQQHRSVWLSSVACRCGNKQRGFHMQAHVKLLLWLLLHEAP